MNRPMITRFLFISIAVLLLALAASLWISTQAAPTLPAPQASGGIAVPYQETATSPARPADAGWQPDGTLNYQGRLMQSGLPYNGDLAIGFRLYASESAIVPTWVETQTVHIEDGLFSVRLGVVTPLSLPNGFSLQYWLGIWPASAAAELSPRQPLDAAPYAMSLVPGASVWDMNPDAPYTYSLSVWSDYRTAIYGGSALTGTAGVMGIHGLGVFSGTTPGIGVYGLTLNGGDTSQAAGVWGEIPSGGGDAVRGNKLGTWGRAVYGTNYGTGSGVAGESTNYVGLWGESANDWGIYGRTLRADKNYGLRTEENLYSLNFHTAGAIMQLAQNGGSEALAMGDVVVFSGVAAPLQEGYPPVILVAKATTANSTAVAGVVYSRYNIAALASHPSSDGQGSQPVGDITPIGPVAPGEYLLVVVQGPALARVSALAGPIQPGDLLASSGQAGYAARAMELVVEGVAIAAPGSVFGKALEALEAGEKLIYVYVTLQ